MNIKQRVERIKELSKLATGKTYTLVDNSEYKTDREAAFLIEFLIKGDFIFQITKELERLWRIEEYAESAVYRWKQNELFITEMILLKQALAEIKAIGESVE